MLAQIKIAPVKSAILINYDLFNYLIINRLFSDAEFREDVLQDFVGGDGTAARDGAEVGDDLADFFAQKVGRKAVGETFEGFTECLAGR